MHDLIVLHRYWLAADAVKQFIAAKLPGGDTTKLPNDLVGVAEIWSGILRMQVFYGLMYVVIEGYRELDCHDTALDELLSQTHYVEALRRFRNATFHFQKEFIPPKLLAFLEAEDSDKWMQSLYSAFNAFFMKNLPIKEFIESLKASAPCHLTRACRRTGGQRWFAARWPSPRSVAVRPPPLTPSR